MLKSPPSSSVGRRLSRVQLKQKQLQLKAIHRPRFKKTHRDGLGTSMNECPQSKQLAVGALGRG
ncbi:unnamed protein product [Staurois parvus]|uniref:Uncharacterized protein n=1 Tax=Staurois parvus TaxID=386267 RepID=A0ABN9BW81_9NEOB|nr:unnamed protein product [Staurois parvus]